MIIIDYIRKTKEKAISAIKLLKTEPLSAIAYLIPVIMICITTGVGIVALIKYVADGILLNQINIIMQEGLLSATKGFTAGTATLLTSGIVSISLWLLSFTNIIVVLLLFYKNESRNRKLFLTISLVLAGIIIVFILIITLMDIGIIPISRDVMREIKELYWTTAINGIPMVAVVGGILLMISLIVSVWSLLHSQEAGMFKDGVLHIIIVFIVMPLAITLIENIIPLMAMLVGGAIAFLIIGIVIFILIKMLFSGFNNSEGSRSRGDTYNSTTINSKYSNQREIKNWSGPFWRDKGGFGLGQPQADCIYVYNAQKDKQWICTVSEYEKGEVAIIDAKTKTRVMDIAGCKRPVE